MRHCLAAWTAPGCNYPSYVSINQEGDQVEITVRSEYTAGGTTASVNLTVDEFQALLSDATENSRA